MNDIRKPPKAALFDLDGTLFDTDPANFLSYRDAFAQFGCALTETQWRETCAGRCFRDFQPALFACDTQTAAAIHRVKKERYPRYLSHCRPNGGVLCVAQSLKGTMPLAVVTTASRKNTIELLDHFQVRALFSLLITQEDVERAKPDPACYLLAFARLGITPAEALIFEDSPAGIAAARQAGGQVLIVDTFHSQQGGPPA